MSFCESPLELKCSEALAILASKHVWRTVADWIFHLFQRFRSKSRICNKIRNSLIDYHRPWTWMRSRSRIQTQWFRWSPAGRIQWSWPNWIVFQTGANYFWTIRTTVNEVNNDKFKFIIRGFRLFVLLHNSMCKLIHNRFTHRLRIKTTPAYVYVYKNKQLRPWPFVLVCYFVVKLNNLFASGSVNLTSSSG